MSPAVALLLLALTRPTHTCDELGGAPPAAERAPTAAPVAAPPRVVLRAAPKPAPPPVAQAERARYRIDYGVVSIGDLELVIGAAVPGAVIVRADGHGAGGLLGLGRMDERLSTELDLTRLDSRRWASSRTDGDGAVNDRAEQATAGRVRLVREHPGGADAGAATLATTAGPVLDPLGFLLRLRIAPPSDAARAAPQTLYVLDGQALWRVTITNVGRVFPPENAAPVPMIRLEAEAEPIRWDGVLDAGGDRKRRSFKLWLSDDAARVPLRLEMPVGIANIVVALTEITRR